MNSGLYAACAGLTARTAALDTIAANVANSSSAGYRGQENVFGTVLAEAKHHTLHGLNRVVNTYGVLSGTEQDETQGELTRTGNDLDVAIQGAGYFKVQTATGAAYTRNGAFQLTADGKLVTSTGDAVMGDGGLVTLPRGKVSISGDGTISVDGTLAGRLKMVTFKPGTKLTMHGLSNYAAKETDEEPATGSDMVQGALESSNVSAVEGMVQLISAQRAAEGMRHVLSMIDGEMDKTAATELSRVNG